MLRHTQLLLPLRSGFVPWGKDTNRVRDEVFARILAQVMVGQGCLVELWLEDKPKLVRVLVAQRRKRRKPEPCRRKPPQGVSKCSAADGCRGCDNRRRRRHSAR